MEIVFENYLARLERLRRSWHNLCGAAVNRRGHLVVVFTSLLLFGIIGGQLGHLFGSSLHSGDGHAHGHFAGLGAVIMMCLAFIMIRVGQHSSTDKSSDANDDGIKDVFAAMGAATVPWLLLAGYFMFYMHSPDAWFSHREWLLMLMISRCAAPTSAGILLSMMSNSRGSKSADWVIAKLGRLAVLDDLETIIFLVLLQMVASGFTVQLALVGAISIALLVFGMKFGQSVRISGRWPWIIVYSVGIVALCYGLALLGIHLEVLLPAYVLGRLIQHSGSEEKNDEIFVSDLVSGLFLLLIGLNMPALTVGSSGLSSTELIGHVAVVTVLLILGKLVTAFFYRDRPLRERMAIATGMVLRGEVGMGVLALSHGYPIAERFFVVASIALAVNLCLTPVFVGIAKALIQPRRSLGLPLPLRLLRSSVVRFQRFTAGGLASCLQRICSFINNSSHVDGASNEFVLVGVQSSLERSCRVTPASIAARRMDWLPQAFRSLKRIQLPGSDGERQSKKRTRRRFKSGRLSTEHTLEVEVDRASPVRGPPQIWRVADHAPPIGQDTTLDLLHDRSRIVSNAAEQEVRSGSLACRITCIGQGKAASRAPCSKSLA